MRSWLEIDINQLSINYKVYRSLLPENLGIMAVVKANAYGCGDVEISRALMRDGVRCFAVSNIDEAIKLRKAEVKGSILILGYTPPDRLEELVLYDISQTIISPEYADVIVNKGYKIKAHFAIDSGMNRIGFDADCVEKCCSQIRYYAKNMDVEGIFTHLSVADTPSENHFTESQIQKFFVIKDSLDDLNFRFVHCLNSAGGLYHQPAGNIVRLGIVLYGLKPDYQNVLPPNIKPIIKWKSVVSMIKEVQSGESVGYGRSFIADKKLKIATVPTGYADGYNRKLSNCGKVFINGVPAPIVGRVCMDQFMVDVTRIPNITMGDEVTLLDENYTADDMGRAVGTIGYEVICNISSRVKRIYI